MKVASAAALICLLLSTTFSARIAAADEAPLVESKPGNELPTIIVTARRGEEAAQAVPLSMVVLEGDELERAGLSAATSLPERVSGLVVMAPNPRLTSFSIRGLGSNTQNDGIESSVGLFMDGVYLGRSGFSVFDLVDIERIEVLRGPQGTLFGKNTTAGAIHILTRLPEREFGGTAEATLGEYGTRQLRGTVTGPIVDDLAGRLTGYLTQRDGLTTNLYDGERLNDRDRRGLRGQLLWTPTSTLSGRFIAEWGRIDEDCCAYPLAAPVHDTILDRDAYMEYTRVSTDPQDRLADSDGPTHYDIGQHGLSAEFAWDAAEHLQFTSLTAWRDWRFVPQSDDATSLRLIHNGIANEHSQFSQELRLNTRIGDAETVAGLYYLHQRIDGNDVSVVGDELASWLLGGLIRERLPFATRSNTGAVLDLLIPPQTLDGMVVDLSYGQRTDSIAGYGSIRLPLNDALALDVGTRYTYEWKWANVAQVRYGGDPNASVLAQTNNLSALGDLIGVDLSDLTFDGLLDSVAGERFSRTNRRDEGSFSGNAALTQTLSRDWRIYASAARGYKSGGINLGVVGETGKPTFSPEKITNFEIGSKSRLFGRHLDLAFAAYYADVRDYQALTFDETRTLIPNPRQNNLLNIGRLRMRGAELEVAAAIGSALRLRAGVSYNEAITVDFTNAPDEDTRENTQDLSGESLFNAPRWTWNVGAEYRKPISSSLAVYAALDHSYRGGAYATLEHGRASYVDAYQLTNLRLGLGSSDDHWQLTAWVRNVFDTEYIGAVRPLYGVGDYGQFAGDPRMAGLTVRLSW